MATTGSFTAAGQSVVFANPYGRVGVVVTAAGAVPGTVLTFWQSDNGSNWSSSRALRINGQSYDIGSWTSPSDLAGPYYLAPAWLCILGPCQQIKVMCSTYVSGTIAITVNEILGQDYERLAIQNGPSRFLPGYFSTSRQTPVIEIPAF